MKMLGIESIYQRLCSVLLVAIFTTMSLQATSETMVGSECDTFLSGLDTQCSESPSSMSSSGAATAGLRRDDLLAYIIQQLLSLSDCKPYIGRALAASATP